MRISVLIATCNRPDHLKNCLQSLLDNSRPPDEIIVADQSDGYATEETVAGIASGSTVIRYERLDRRGKSRALNRAVEICAGDFLALTDDDVMVDKKWLETFLQLSAEYPGIEAFCGRMLPEEGGAGNEEYLNLVLETNTKWIDKKTNPVQPGFVGANCFISRRAFLAAGRFNELFGPGAVFPSNEDGELACRLISSGTKILYSPKLVVFHSGWRGRKDNRKLKFNYAYGQGGIAGYCLRQGRLMFGWHILLIFLQKLRRLTLGLLLADQERIQDGAIHLKGIVAGFLKGLAVK
ncbi:MAG: glycosyltransferase [Desulfobacterales bacterium]|nr:glycosyltransferase [Desulfobacterales bacterium]